MTNKLEIADFGVCEMTSSEAKQRDGGFWIPVAIGVAIVAAQNIIDNWDDFKSGFASAF